MWPWPQGKGYRSKSGYLRWCTIDFCSSFFSDYLNTFNHLNMKLFVFIGSLQVLKFEFLKFRILEILNFHPCMYHEKCFHQFIHVAHKFAYLYSDIDMYYWCLALILWYFLVIVNGKCSKIWINFLKPFTEILVGPKIEINVCLTFPSSPAIFLSKLHID